VKPIADSNVIFTDKEHVKKDILSEIERDLDLCKPVVDENSAYMIDWKIVYGKLFGK
jgi:hypothetical protein